jgi:hypothetical protein
VPKVHNKPIKRPRKGSNKKSKRQPKCALVWRTGLSGAPPDSVRCTREFQSELATFGNSRKPLRCVAPDCPVCQQSNGYYSTNGRLQRQLMRYSARRSQSRARSRTGQSTGPVRCTTGLSGDPEDRSSNGRTLMVG